MYTTHIEQSVIKIINTKMIKLNEARLDSWVYWITHTRSYLLSPTVKRWWLYSQMSIKAPFQSAFEDEIQKTLVVNPFLD